MTKTVRGTEVFVKGVECFAVCGFYLPGTETKCSATVTSPNWHLSCMDSVTFVSTNVAAGAGVTYAPIPGLPTPAAATPVLRAPGLEEGSEEERARGWYVLVSGDKMVQMAPLVSQ
jgi:hypothetical protein